MPPTKLIALTRAEAEWIYDRASLSNPQTRTLALKLMSVVSEFEADAPTAELITMLQGQVGPNTTVRWARIDTANG